MLSYKLMDWDSQFFGMTVAKIIPPRLTAHALDEALQELKADGARLVYWASDPDDEESQGCARERMGLLIDVKTTFAIDSKDMQGNVDRLVDCGASVEEYLDLVATPELEKLALEAGMFSRFKLDPKIPTEKFVELYKLWIQRSVARDIADKVFVVQLEGKVAGMVTVGEKDGRADIGLLAVDTALRGKNAGKALVHAAQQWALRGGYTTAQVVTQGANTVACNFYRKCGYRVDKVENVYHLWVNK